jgi:hypothetical protein
VRGSQDVPSFRLGLRGIRLNEQCFAAKLLAQWSLPLERAAAAVPIEKDHPCHVSARVVQTSDKMVLHRIGSSGEDNRHSGRRVANSLAAVAAAITATGRWISSLTSAVNRSA